jgi:hypothetical protein
VQGELEGNQDRCFVDSRNNSKLQEFFCGMPSDGGGYIAVRDKNVTCPYGCSNGACVCSDSDGGIDYDVQGTIAGYSEYCYPGSRQVLMEFNPILNGNNCTVQEISHICEGICSNGACQPPTCSDGIRNQNETDVDCGGPNCAACGYIKITGFLKYEEANSDSSGGYNNPSGFPRFKPIRYVTVSLTPTGYTALTNNDGYFEFVIPRSVGSQYGLRIRPTNYAANVEKDFDGCNEYVWFDSAYQLTVPPTGQMDFGELDVYIDRYYDSGGYYPRVINHQYSDALGGNRSGSYDFIGKWHEEYSCVEIFGIVFGCFCGTVDNELGEGGATYFNIAENLRLGYNFATSARDLSDRSDVITQASVQYPDSVDNAMYSETWGEIDLPYSLSPNFRAGLMDVTILHEYGHKVQDNIAVVDGVSGDHTVCSRHDAESAFGEGFAEFFGSYITNKYSNDPQYYTSKTGGWYGEIESPSCSVDQNVEIANMAVLWDLVDSPGSDYPDAVTESFDTISNQEHAIMYIMDTEMDNDADAPDICQFVWGTRGWKFYFTGLPEASAIDSILAQYHITNDC